MVTFGHLLLYQTFLLDVSQPERKFGIYCKFAFHFHGNDGAKFTGKFQRMLSLRQKMIYSSHVA